MEEARLIREALLARERAYAPHSGFLVGAALLTRDGAVYTGCNIENAAFSPTNCAERTALFTAVAAGARDFAALAVVGGKRDARLEFCFPCGVCRQVLTEFCPPEFPVLVARSEQDYAIYTLGELLPHSFGRANLE